MERRMISGKGNVDCRIGSLETCDDGSNRNTAVDCRIGSLEIENQLQAGHGLVDCRIGGRIGTPAGMQEGKMKKSPFGRGFF